MKLYASLWLGFMAAAQIGSTIAFLLGDTQQAIYLELCAIFIALLPPSKK